MSPIDFAYERERTRRIEAYMQIAFYQTNPFNRFALNTANDIHGGHLYLR